MSFLYLGALLISIAGMVILDRRFRLFFWAPVRRAQMRAAVVLVVGVVFFLFWDVVGIDLGVFFRGNPGLLTGVQLVPELPIEEVFFLTLLCYLTMNLYGAASRRGRDS